MARSPRHTFPWFAALLVVGVANLGCLSVPPCASAAECGGNQSCVNGTCVALAAQEDGGGDAPVTSTDGDSDGDGLEVVPEVTGPCASMDCSPGARCVVTSGIGACECDDGYLGDGSECHRAVPAFSIAVIGDLKSYTADSANTGLASDLLHRASAMASLVATSVDVLNLRLVVQTGDLVTRGDRTSEWLRAADVLHPISSIASLPLAVSMGDRDATDADALGSDATDFLGYFGPSGQPNVSSPPGRSGFNLSGSGGTGDGRSSYQLVRGSGRQILHLALEAGPSTASSRWAQAVMDRHLGTPTVLTTHLGLGDQRPGEGPQSGTPPLWLTETGLAGDGRLAPSEWVAQLVAPNPQVFATLTSHTCCERLWVTTNNAGLEVFNLQVNHGPGDLGVSPDGGWFRLLQFDEAEARLRLKTLRASVPAHGLEAASDPYPTSQMDIPFDWDTRFPAVRHFRDGVGGYDGTVDTWFSERTIPPERTGFAAGEYVRTGRWDEANQQAVIRFDGMVGSGASQIPAGAVVGRAVLTLQVLGDGEGEAAALYRMLVPWQETDGYDAPPWTGGTPWIDRDDVEAAIVQDDDLQEYAAPSSLTIESGSLLSLDVTESVQGWVDGAPNHGWLLESLGQGGGNGLFLASSDHPDVGRRPQLSVVLQQAPRAMKRAVFQRGLDGYDQTAQAMVDASSSGPVPAVVALRVEGGTSPVQSLIRFDGLVGGSGPVPVGAVVVAAELHLTSTPTGGSPETQQVTRLLWPWPDSITWVTTPGANGFQKDGLEAALFPDDQTRTPVVGTAVFDVTDTVRAWVSGAVNYGWLVTQTDQGISPWLFHAHTSNVAASRPRLVVWYRAAETP